MIPTDERDASTRRQGVTNDDEKDGDAEERVDAQGDLLPGLARHEESEQR